MWFNSIVGIWVTVGLFIAFAIPPAEGLRATPAAFFHIPMAIAMEVAFVLAAYHGARWLQRRDTRHDALSLAYAESGMACGLIATVTGATWARINWNSYWSWDPQQVGIVATLLTYGALFALRAAVEDEDKQRDLWAVYAIIGVIAAIFWTFIFRKLLASLHPDGNLTQSDPLFRFALWFNIAGYVMLLVRVARLRARLEMVSQRLKDWQWA